MQPRGHRNNPCSRVQWKLLPLGMRYINGHNARRLCAVQAAVTLMRGFLGDNILGLFAFALTLAEESIRIPVTAPIHEAVPGQANHNDK